MVIEVMLSTPFSTRLKGCIDDITILSMWSPPLLTIDRTITELQTSRNTQRTTFSMNLMLAVTIDDPVRDLLLRDLLPWKARTLIAAPILRRTRERPLTPHDPSPLVLTTLLSRFATPSLIASDDDEPMQSPMPPGPARTLELTQSMLNPLASLPWVVLAERLAARKISLLLSRSRGVTNLSLLTMVTRPLLLCEHPTTSTGVNTRLTTSRGTSSAATTKDPPWMCLPNLCFTTTSIRDTTALPQRPLPMVWTKTLPTEGTTLRNECSLMVLPIVVTILCILLLCLMRSPSEAQIVRVREFLRTL